MNIKRSKIWLASLLVVVIISLLAVSYTYHINAPLKGVKIHLNDDEVYSYLQKDDINRLLIENKRIDITQMSIKNANLEALEQVALSHPWIAATSLYIDNGRYLNIEVVQRVPVARVYEEDGLNYYIDSTLNVMPPAVGYAYPVVVFTGVPAIKDTLSILAMQRKILYLANFIARDTFWSKQIVQVQMNEKHQFSFATLVGNQIVTIGDTSHLATKFENLYTFYKQVNNTIGWEKYTHINLSYTNQVVAYPSLGWVPPKPTDTLVVVPTVIEKDDLLESLPEQPMEEATMIKKDIKDIKQTPISNEVEAPKNLEIPRNDSAKNI